MIKADSISIRYFTGTGNSWFIAKTCAAAFDEKEWKTDIAPIAEADHPAGTPPLDRAEAACFVFPVYSLDIPRVVRRWLSSLPHRGHAPGGGNDAAGIPSLILVTGGAPDDCGWALIEASRILRMKGYDPVYADLVYMPNNWGTFSIVPSGDEASNIVSAGERKARTAVQAFLSGERYSKPLSLSTFGPLGSRLLRAGFKRGVKRMWKMYRVAPSCTGCGLCARTCPLGAIEMKAAGTEGTSRPSWTASCEQCMRCFNICPSRSILQLEAVGHGSQRARWMAPGFVPPRRGAR
jgi:ferredoxin